MKINLSKILKEIDFSKKLQKKDLGILYVKPQSKNGCDAICGLGGCAGTGRKKP